jgi:hypothetical protein
VPVVPVVSTSFGRGCSGTQHGSSEGKGAQTAGPRPRRRPRNLSVAFWAAAPVFTGGRAERTIRWLSALNFPVAFAAFVAFWLLTHDLVAVEVTVLMINCLVPIVAGTLVSLLFRRAGRRWMM